MVVSLMNCPCCRRPLVQIDYYGEVLVGCLDCIRCGRPGDKRLVMELLEDDLAAFGRVENGAVVDDVTDGAGRDVRWNDAWPSPRLAVLVLLASAA